MTHDEQANRLDRMEFHRSHDAEMKLRRMAVDAATSQYRPIRFAVHGSIMFHQRNVDSLPLSCLPEIEVNLWPGITDHDARVLIAEEILRPQLRAAGWRV